MIAPLLFGLVVLSMLVVAPAWMSCRARTRLLARIRAERSHPRSRPREMEDVADFFRTQDARETSLDDRTWNDLLMDGVFAHLDRTESSVGQQMLHRRLRSAPAPPSLDAFDALVASAADDAGRRERTQAVLTPS